MRQGSVRIVGGGVAGLTAAIQLARRGVEVEVFEARPDSVGVRATRFDAAENWTTRDDFKDHLANWAIDTALFRPTSSIEVHAFDGECHRLHLRRPLVYVVKRGNAPGCLEHGLKRRAIELGVEIHYRATLPREEADIWAVGSSRGGFFLDAGITFRTAQPDRVAILIDARRTPKAYAYLIVNDGMATLAVLLTRQFRQARTLLDQTIESFQRIQPFDMHEVRLCSGFGGAPNALAANSGGPLVVGEAAGFLDYLWGFGIRHAMLSGTLAAQALLGGGDYAHLIDNEVRPLVQSSLINRMFFDAAGNRGYRALIRYLCARPDLHGLLLRAYQSHRVRSLFWHWAARSLARG